MNRAPARRIAIVGMGSIGRVVFERLRAAGPQVCAVLVRPGHIAAEEAALPPGVRVCGDYASVLETRPHAVVETAGQEAVRQIAAATLEAGTDLFVISSGALADAVLFSRIEAAARAHGARVFVPAGAIAGLDGLCALRSAGLDDVRYTSTKPPAAWKGTPADATVDLDALDGRTTIFEGTAREAAQIFPKNANLAATVALAGIGFERTRVHLVADPSAAGNTGRIEARGAAGDLLVEMSGPASRNPKTSASTAYSLARAVERYTAEIVLPDEHAAPP